MDIAGNALENLKNAVVKFLIVKHDFSSEDAEEAVAESVISSPMLWSANAEAESLADSLASEGEED